MAVAMLRRQRLLVGRAWRHDNTFCPESAPKRVIVPRTTVPLLGLARGGALTKEWGQRCFTTSRPLLAARPGFGHARATWKDRQRQEESDQQVWWLAAGLVAVFGGVWALVPLYKIYCQSTGQGQAVVGHKEYSAPPEAGSAASKRLITVDFQGTVHDALPWDFVPQQRRMVVGVGETALAFYRAKNNTDKPIIGVSVYHMIPPESGLYFNKIQCFCFDEQLINPNEEVDLPIFFFIDPLMAQDSRFDHVDRITLSYLFFESDSDLPEEYEDFVRGNRTSQTPLVLDAPSPGVAGAAATADASHVAVPGYGTAAPVHGNLSGDGTTRSDDVVAQSL